MIRRSPAEVYLKYLIAHPDQYSNDKIKEMAMFAKVDYLGGWYLNRLRAQMPKPVPFYPNDPKHKPSMRFLLEHGLHALFFQNKPMREAFQLLRFPRGKQWIEVMLIMGVPPWDISQQLTRSLNFRCSDQTIECYRDVFFNTDLLDMDELRALMDLRATQVENHPDPEIQAQAAAVKKASYRSGLRTAVNLPMTPAASFLAMMDMGLMPARIDTNKVLELAFRNTAMRALETSYTNGPGDAQRCHFWSAGARSLFEILKENVNVEDQMREQLSSLKIKRDQLDMPTVRALTGGNVTQNLEPEHKDEYLPTTDDDLGGQGEEPFDE